MYENKVKIKTKMKIHINVILGIKIKIKRIVIMRTNSKKIVTIIL